jgi:hypothetical protein
MKLKLNFNLFDKILLTFFIFGSLFITIRLLLIGSKGSTNISEFFLSVLPEIFISVIALIFIKLRLKLKTNINYLDWMFIVYILSNVFLGLIVGADIKLGIYGFRLTYIPMFFYFFGSFSLSTKNQTIDLIDYVFKWFVVIGGVGILLYFVFYDFMMSALLLVSKEACTYFIVRMTSIFWSPVVFGTFMTVSFLYFYYKSVQYNSYWNYVFQGVLFVCILLSMSRGPIIAVIIGLIALTILSKKWKKCLLSFSLMFVLFVPVGYYIATPVGVVTWIISSTSNVFMMKDGETRTDLYRSSLSGMRDHLLGYGLGKAGHVARRFSKVDKNVNEENSSLYCTDGWFVKLICETGLWGIGSYLVVSVFLFLASIKYILKNEFDFFSFLFTVFMVSNVVNLVSNILDFYLYSNLYWLLIGVMVYYLKNNSKYESA